MMGRPIVLETSRLILRPHEVGDFADMVSLWTEPEVTRFTSGNKPRTPEECWRNLLSHRGSWTLLGFGYFAICEKTSGAFLGEAGLADSMRQITPNLAGLAEAGWAILPSDWGRGYAFEAMTAILEWYSASAHPRPVVCIMNPANESSFRLASKLGFKEKTITEYNGNPWLMMEL